MAPWPTRRWLLALAVAAQGSLAMKMAPARAVEKAKPVSALQKDAPDMPRVPGAAPLLLSLLKELKGEAEATMKYSASMTKWCKDTKAQKVSMITVLQRQLDEVAVAMQQVRTEEGRLSAQEHLANSMAQEKQTQLQKAATTARFAHAEFDSEQRQVDKTIDAASRTIHFIKMQQAQQAGEGSAQATWSADGSLDADMSYSLMQLSSDHMTEDERSLVNLYTSSTSGAPMGRADELLQMLTALRMRLQQERLAEMSEQAAMMRKLDGFSDHLNSSIMETQSQVAAIRMEAAQRKRAKVGWDSKVADVSTMLAAVTASKDAVESTCRDDGKRRRELAAHIANELSYATALLKRIPSSSSYLLFGEPDGEAAPSFVQVGTEESMQMTAVKKAMEDMKLLARQFPEESTLYASGEQLLSKKAPGSMLRMAKGHSEVSKDASKALLSIQQFVKDNNGVAGDNGLRAATEQAMKGEKESAVYDEVKSTYSGILGNVRAKAHTINDAKSHCASILRDADMDAASLERSMKRISAKLHIAQVAVSEHERSSVFQDQERINIKTQLEQLTRMAQQSEHESQQFLEALRGHAEQLIALTTDLEPAEQEGDSNHLGKAVRELAQKVESHQATLQQNQRRFVEQKTVMGAAEQNVLRLLAANAAHNRRRLIGVKAEVQLLTSLAAAKADDFKLSQQYQDLANKLCSEDKVEKMGGKIMELQREIKSLQRSIAQVGASAVTEAGAATKST